LSDTNASGSMLVETVQNEMRGIIWTVGAIWICLSTKTGVPIEATGKQIQSADNAMEAGKSIFG
jgi:hypothetical protein